MKAPTVARDGAVKAVLSLSAHRGKQMRVSGHVSDGIDDRHTRLLAALRTTVMVVDCGSGKNKREVRFGAPCNAAQWPVRAATAVPVWVQPLPKLSMGHRTGSGPWPLRQDKAQPVLWSLVEWVGVASKVAPWNRCPAGRSKSCRVPIEETAPLDAFDGEHLLWGTGLALLG